MSITLQRWPANIQQADVPANTNAVDLEAVVQLSVESVASDAPATSSGDVGKVWIVGAGTWPASPSAPSANDIAICTAASIWRYLTPEEGWLCWNKASAEFQSFSGSAWAAFAGGGGGGASVGVQYAADLDSTADSDPGAGLMKWNNATQASATELYLDDTTADAADLSGWWSALDSGGFAYLQHATNQDVWQIWEITTVTDATGYVKLAVTLLAKGADFADGDAMLVTLQQGASGGGFANPMTTAGDIITATTGGAAQRLAVGANGYVLTVVGGVPTWAAGGGGGGLTNWTEAVNASGINTTVPVVSFTATDAATNVDAAILAKGNGATLAQIPDNTTAGGVKRGQYAVDWQKARMSAGNVASGDYSTIGGGYNNIANNSFSTVAGGSTNSATTPSATVGGGSSNTASGSVATVGGGTSNVASGSYATIPGGQLNTASQTYAFATGRSCVADADNAFASGQYAQCRGIKGAFARSQNFLASAGDAGYRDFMLAVSTTDATPTTITTNAAAAATNNQVVLANNSAVQVHGRILGRSSTGDVASFEVDVTLFRGASAATTVVVGTATSTQLAATAGASAWAVTLTANTTTGCLKIEVTGAASTSIKWSGWLRSVDMY